MKCGASRVVLIRGQLQLPPTPQGSAFLHKAQTLPPNPRGTSLRCSQPSQEIHIFLWKSTFSYGNPHSEKLLQRNEVMGDAHGSPTLFPVKAIRECG